MISLQKTGIHWFFPREKFVETIKAPRNETISQAPDSTEQLVVSWLSQEARAAAGETGPSVMAKEEEEEEAIKLIEGIIW